MREFIGTEHDNKTAAEKQALIELARQGRDAPGTAQILGAPPPPVDNGTNLLPDQTNVTGQGDTNALQRFINIYQPGELVARQNFRKHLLQVLEEWKGIPHD